MGTKSLTPGLRLEFDEANSHIGHKDKRKRTLAYVFLEDGTFLNAEIFKQRYRFAYTRFPFKYLDEFRRWSERQGSKEEGITGFLLNGPDLHSRED